MPEGKTGTKAFDNGWPMEIEFTDKYPLYYLEKLQNGEDWEKELSMCRLSNNTANNTLMWELAKHPGIDGKSVVQILEEAHFYFKEKGRENSLTNILSMLGVEKYYRMGPYIDGRFNWDHEKQEKIPQILPKDGKLA